jgi:hypothetical protein
MNRREFIKSLFATTAALATTDIDKLLEETKFLPDKEFVVYVTSYMSMMVSMPSQCAIITDIEE